MADEKKAGKKEVINKIDTLRSLHTQQLITTEMVMESIKKLKEEGSVRVLPLSFFENAPAELVEFARKFSLIKEKGAGTSEHVARGPKGTSLGAIVRAAFPDVDALLKPVDDLTGKVFEVEVDGTKVQIAYQPFWRRIVAKEVKEGTTATV
jgi:hypothetical protein